MLDKIKKIRQELDELEREITYGNSQNELKQQISKLIYCYRGDFITEISAWKKIIEREIHEKGFQKATLSFPYHVISPYKETGLACSVDISTGIGYNSYLRSQLSKLISQYGRVKVMTEICREAKRINILKEI